jgi:hypothetical protein
VKVYGVDSTAQLNGTGMFAREVMTRFPLLPLEEEGHLNDMLLRENLIEGVLPVGKARQGPLSLDGDAGRGANARRPGPCLFVPGHLCLRTSAGRQVPYSTQADADGAPWRRQPLLRRTGRTGSPKHYTEMGRLVADAGKRDWAELTAEYGAQLMEGLGVMGTRGKHVNVLQHLRSTAPWR